MAIVIKETTWQASAEDLTLIRTTVFVEEQKVPKEIEIDDMDDTASHWLAFHNDIPVGTCRMLSDGHIGRMAVLAAHRSSGVGQQLLQAAVDKATTEKLYEVYLHAQLQALDFYRKFGFVEYGEEFFDAGIPHKSMRISLSKTRILGQHSGDFKVNNFSQSALELIQQSKHKIRILSYSLDPKIYDQASIVDAISTLARKSRNTEIRILIVNSSQLVGKRHRLVEIQKRLPSNIYLRNASSLAHEIKFNWVIADQAGFISQSIKEPDNAWGNFNNKPTTDNYISQFDDFWEHSVIDKELQSLSL